ncbi:hypothetical protein MMC30_001231 [Trapelia coarctata]|nr:hypothetical protein [Trapelia coarctata]
MLTPKDPTAFTDAMADLLRLPDETLAMAYIYLHKYNRFLETSNTTSPLDPYTLSLATVSLAAKSTESPRPPSAILLPAHRLLHPPLPTSTQPPLTTSSPTYPRLRQTLLSAELVLLRVLGFECRLPSPLSYIERYLARALDEIVTPSARDGGGRGGGGERGEKDRDRDRERGKGEGVVDYTRWSREEREEYGVIPLLETGLGREVRRWAGKACKSAEIVNFWPSRAVGLGCVWMAVDGRGLGLGLVGVGGEERGVERGGEREDGERVVRRQEGEWVRRVGGGKVDLGDFKEVVWILGGL